jgi:hypothetical protein
MFSADLASLLSAPWNLHFWSWLNVFHRPEGALFPGITGLLLVVATLAVGRRPATTGTRGTWIAMAAGSAGALLLVVAVAAARAPWRLQLLHWQITSRDARRPLLLAAICLLVTLIASPRLRDAVRRRSVLAFYALAAAGAWAMCLGPAPTLLGEPGLPAGPYALLQGLPGVGALRVPARFAIVMALCLAVAAAIAYARLAIRLPPWARGALIAAVTLLATVDTWTADPYLERRPYPHALRQHLAGPTLELPIGDPTRDVLVMYRHIGSVHPVVNGYSGHFPRWYGDLAQAIDAQSPEAFEVLASAGVRHIVVDRLATRDPALESSVARHAALVASDQGHALYTLPPRQPLTFGSRLPIAAVSATVAPDLVPLMIDDDLATRWHSDAQLGDEAVQIDLGAPAAVGAIVIASGPYIGDAPLGLIVDVSIDGRTWTEVWRGNGRWAQLGGMMREPRRAAVTCDLSGRTTRVIRLRQAGFDPARYWSIAELTVLAPAKAR